MNVSNELDHTGWTELTPYMAVVNGHISQLENHSITLDPTTMLILPVIRLILAESLKIIDLK